MCPVAISDMHKRGTVAYVKNDSRKAQDAIIVSFLAVFCSYYCVTVIWPIVKNKFRLHNEKSETMKKLRRRQLDAEDGHTSDAQLRSTPGTSDNRVRRTVRVAASAISFIDDRKDFNDELAVQTAIENSSITGGLSVKKSATAGRFHL